MEGGGRERSVLFCVLISIKRRVCAALGRVARHKPTIINILAYCTRLRPWPPQSQQFIYSSPLVFMSPAALLTSGTLHYFYF
jgi:hypothetical protein